MGSCAAPSAKGDDKFITTDYLQQCPSWQVNIRLPFIRHCCKNVEVIGVLRRNPRFFRPFKLSTVEQLDPVRPQLTNRGNMPVQSLPGYPKFLA
ncbi:hypothetical protein CR535_28350 (plasmid) [Escherichia coli]|nr:hypothetical protein CR535_28350 [Escherichia coli]